ncbi:MAG: DMT family transporter [Rhizobiales bacterium]|nr:DMT family transporter [Hyphomicrobiales bacterium]
MPRSRDSIGLLLGLAAVVLFGGSLPATRIAVLSLDPWFVTAARSLTAGLVGLAIVIAARLPFPRIHLGRLAAIAACLVIGFPAFLSLATVTVPASHGSVILALLPIATTIGAVLFAGERPSLAFWLITLLGAALVAVFALREGDVALVVGDLFLVVGVLVCGSGYAIAATLSRMIPGWQVITWAVVVSLPVSLPATILLWPVEAAGVPAAAWLGIAYGGIVSQFIAYAIWNAALAMGGVARIGQLQLLQPFVTFLIAMPLLGERIDALTVAFAVAVAAVVAAGRHAAVRRR